MEIYTVGFTKKTARDFFEILRAQRIERLIDVRINNTSQLSGFAKRDDLMYFLTELVGADYEHREELAPTKELLAHYRNKEIDWSTYEQEFMQLMVQRRPDLLMDRELFAIPTVLLCSEHKPGHCHRRLVVEYLDETWGGVEARHL